RIRDPIDDAAEDSLHGRQIDDGQVRKALYCFPLECRAGGVVLDSDEGYGALRCHFECAGLEHEEEVRLELCPVDRAHARDHRLDAHARDIPRDAIPDADIEVACDIMLDRYPRNAWL